MTTVRFTKGQIVLPSSVRDRLYLEPGPDFEVIAEDGDTITLRRLSRRPNQRLVDHILACPCPFEIPPRTTDSTRPVEL